MRFPVGELCISYPERRSQGEANVDSESESAQNGVRLILKHILKDELLSPRHRKHILPLNAEGRLRAFR
jgi:hypothetical protein